MTYISWTIQFAFYHCHRLKLFVYIKKWRRPGIFVPLQALALVEKADMGAEYFLGWLCWGLTSQSTIFQSYRDGAIASWVINQYFRGVKCLAQGHNTAAVGLEPWTSRSGVRHSTTEPPRSPNISLEIPHTEKFWCHTISTQFHGEN